MSAEDAAVKLPMTPAEVEALDEVTRTAPEKIWLQVSDDADHCAESFPSLRDLEITWCDDSVEACQVAYVRADLHAAALAAQAQQKVIDDSLLREWEKRATKAEAALRQAMPREPTEKMRETFLDSVYNQAMGRFDILLLRSVFAEAWRKACDAAPAAAPGEKP